MITSWQNLDEPANVDSEELIHKAVYSTPPPPSFNCKGNSQYHVIISNCDNEEIIRVSNLFRKLTEAIKSHYVL